MLTAVTLEGLAETLSFVRAGGLQPEALLDALGGGSESLGFCFRKTGAMVKGNFEGGTPIRHLFRDLQFALKLSGSNPAVPATGVVAGLLFGAMKRGWAACDSAIISRAFEPDSPPAQPVPKTEPVVVAPAPRRSEPIRPGTGHSMATTAGPVETPADSAADPADFRRHLPVCPMTLPRAQRHDSRDSWWSRGQQDCAPVLELLHTTPVMSAAHQRHHPRRLRPAAPANNAGHARAVHPSCRARPRRPTPGAKIRPTNTGHCSAAAVSRRAPRVAPFPGQHASPGEPAFERHDQSPGPVAIGTRRRLEQDRGASIAQVSAQSRPPKKPGDGTRGRAIGSHHCRSSAAASRQPAVAPVIPGDIRPSQRIPLRATDPDAQPRPRLIRDPKTKKLDPSLDWRLVRRPLLAGLRRRRG